MSDIIKCPTCKNKRPHEPSWHKMLGSFGDMEWSPPKFDQSGNIMPKIELKEVRLMRCDKGHDFTVKL